MIDQEQIGELSSAIVYDPMGAEVGNVVQVFVDDDWGAPTWVVVQTGVFGLSEALAPVYDALLDGGRLLIGVDQRTVKDAPRLRLQTDPSGHEVIDQRQVAELHHYYRLPYVFRGPQPPRTRIDQSQIQRSQHPTLQSPYERPDRAIGVAQVTAAPQPVGVAPVAGAAELAGMAESASAAQRAGMEQPAGAAAATYPVQVPQPGPWHVASAVDRSADPPAARKARRRRFSFFRRDNQRRG